jgi:hypothetical protein
VLHWLTHEFFEHFLLCELQLARRSGNVEGAKPVEGSGHDGIVGVWEDTGACVVTGASTTAGVVTGAGVGVGPCGEYRNDWEGLQAVRRREGRGL